MKRLKQDETRKRYNKEKKNMAIKRYKINEKIHCNINK